MNKKIFTSLVCCFITTGALAATSIPWWKQPTICRISTTNCYVSMGAGYDAGLWDATGNCRGMKLICPAALTTNEPEPKPVGKTELAHGTGIRSDFDISVLADGCFGARKTSANGTMAAVDNKYVNVWCRGVLDNPDEIVANGEITLGTAPTCTNLADKGYIGVVNGKCYGKYYNPSEYFIDCGNELLPNRIIILNGADYTAGTSANTPATLDAANTLFKNMYEISVAQHHKYFDSATE